MRVPDKRADLPAAFLDDARAVAGDLLAAGLADPQSLQGTQLWLGERQLWGPRCDIEAWFVVERDRITRRCR